MVVAVWGNRGDGVKPRALCQPVTIQAIGDPAEPVP